MRAMLWVTALSAFATPTVAHACSLVSPPVATTAEEIAAKGVLIRGRLIQAFDPDSETPEIIEVEEIYVGDGRPKAYVIYRPKSAFAEARKFRELRKKGYPPIDCGPFFHQEVKVGKAFDRLALMPAASGGDPAATGRWAFHFWNGNVSRERGLDLLLEAAEQHKRLLSRPRKNGPENCQQCAPATH